jgi:hypothetical protein
MPLIILGTTDPVDPIVDGRKLSEYTDTIKPGIRGHQHSTDNLVGYAIRHTIEPDGTVLWHTDGSGRCGHDVVVVDKPTEYGWAIEAAHADRAQNGWAVIDHLYSCGCRSQG